ncbi:hypothetical protein FQZ97_907150 [compost metagenome]
MRGESGELLGLAQARRKRNARRQRGLHRLGQGAHERRGEQARRDGADADAVLREVARHWQRHAHEATLGRAVGLLAHLTVEGGYAGGEHHHAAFAVFQRIELGAGGGKQAAGVVGADQVDRDHLGEVFEWCGRAVLAHHAFGAADAGDVHENARRAVGGGSLVHGGLQAVGVGDVAVAGNAVDLAGHAPGVVQVHIEHRNLGAQAREFARRGFAQARATTGDEGGVSLNVHGVVLVFMLQCFLSTGPCPGHRPRRRWRCRSAGRCVAVRAPA